MSKTVSNQAELDSCISAGETKFEVTGEWNKLLLREGVAIERLKILPTAKVGSVYISGTVTGSVCISGTVTGSVCISGTVTGSVCISGTVTGSVCISGTVTGSVCISGTVTGSVDIYGTAKVGSVYIYGTAKVGSVYIYGTVTGSVYISGTVTGSVCISGTVTGSVCISGTVTGSVCISGTVTGSVDIYGTAKVGSVYIYGTVTGSVDISGTAEIGRRFGSIRSDYFDILKKAAPEVPALIKALREGRINGSAYEGECACLVGSLEKFRGSGPNSIVKRDSERLAEKWFLAIPQGHTPEKNAFARMAVEWAEEFLRLRIKGKMATLKRRVA